MKRHIFLMLGFLVAGLAVAEGNSLPGGRLGQPLGSYLVIEGVRQEGGLTGLNTLRVDTVNGKKLDKPVGICCKNVEALPKETRCVMRGYESGKMIGIPDEVGKKENIPPMQAGWQFWHYFIVTSVAEPGTLKVKSKSESDD